MSTSSGLRSTNAMERVNDTAFGWDGGEPLGERKHKNNTASYAGGVSQKRHDWKIMYNALVAFGNEKGHCNVPLRHSRVKVNDEDSVHLGAWLATQRREHLNGKMKPERLALMQVLVDKGKLEWAPMNHSKQSEQTWPVMFDCLRLYCEERQAENPGTEVSSIPENRRWRHPDGHEVGLGRWMHTQNKQRRAGKLRPDRAAKMNELVDAGVFRWPTQRQFKAGEGGRPQNDHNGYGSDEYDFASDHDDVGGTGGRAFAATGGDYGPAKRSRIGDDDRRAKSKTKTQQLASKALSDYTQYYEPGDVVLQPRKCMTLSSAMSTADLAVQGFMPAPQGGKLSAHLSHVAQSKAIDTLLSAAGSMPPTAEVGKEQVLELARVRTAQMISDMSVDDVQRHLRTALGAPAATRHSTPAAVVFPALLASTISINEFRCDSSAVHGGYPIQPPPISFLVHSLDRQLREQDAAAQTGQTAAPEATFSLLTPEIRMHLQTQVLAHIRVKADAADRYRSLLALAHVAEEEHISRANSLESAHEAPIPMEVVVTAEAAGMDEDDEVFQTTPRTQAAAAASASQSRQAQK